MFKFKKNVKMEEDSKDSPIITMFYEDLLYNDEPILYKGLNKGKKFVLGSSIDEDFKKKIDWHFHVIINDSIYMKFFHREISYLDIMRKSKSIFIIEKAFDNSFMDAYSIEFSDIPKDYLPLEDSFCPLDKCNINNKGGV